MEELRYTPAYEDWPSKGLPRFPHTYFSPAQAKERLVEFLRRCENPELNVDPTSFNIDCPSYAALATIVNEWCRMLSIKTDSQLPAVCDSPHLLKLALTQIDAEILPRLAAMHMSQDQEVAMFIVMTRYGPHLRFITGEAGTGKTTVINTCRRLIGNQKEPLPGGTRYCQAVVVCPTNQAANIANGATFERAFRLARRAFNLHNEHWESFFKNTEKMLQAEFSAMMDADEGDAGASGANEVGEIKLPMTCSDSNHVPHYIIDEISMVGGDKFGQAMIYIMSEWCYQMLVASGKMNDYLLGHEPYTNTVMPFLYPKTGWTKREHLEELLLEHGTYKIHRNAHDFYYQPSIRLWKEWIQENVVGNNHLNPIICVGDFAQLPPVEGGPVTDTPWWQEMFGPVWAHALLHQHRQHHSPKSIEALGMRAFRTGQNNSDATRLSRALKLVTQLPPNLAHDAAVFIYYTNEKVNAKNQEMMDKLVTTTRNPKYFIKATPPVKPDAEGEVDYNSAFEDLGAPSTLVLTVGAPVIIRANYDVDRCIVNSAQAVVIGIAEVPNQNRAAYEEFRGPFYDTQATWVANLNWAAAETPSPNARSRGKAVADPRSLVLQLMLVQTGLVFYLAPKLVELEDLNTPPQVIAQRNQFTLSLGWAMTVYRAQGQTIPNKKIIIDPEGMEGGALIVALSRATNILEQVYIASPTGFALRYADSVKQYLQMCISE
jgi:hypothetical protein